MLSTSYYRDVALEGVKHPVKPSTMTIDRHVPRPV